MTPINGHRSAGSVLDGRSVTDTAVAGGTGCARDEAPDPVRRDEPDRSGAGESVERMLGAIPRVAVDDWAGLRDCIEAVQACAQAATACADACLGEEMVEELTRCIRVLLTAADVCTVTARVLSRPGDPDPTVTAALLSACWAACRRAREVCEEFLPIHHHCQVCARACRLAEVSCRALLTSQRTRRGLPLVPPSCDGES